MDEASTVPAGLGDYFNSLTAPHPVAARSTRNKGRALYATSDLQAGAFILRDSPLCWAPSEPARDASCSRCARFLGSLRQQICRLGDEYRVDPSGVPSEPPMLGLAIRLFPPAVPVHEDASGCWACCDACAAELRLHRADSTIDAAAWAKLERQLSGNKFLLLAAQLLRAVVSLYAASSAEERAAQLHLRPLHGLVSPPELLATTSRAELQSSLTAVRACFRRATARWPELNDASSSAGLLSLRSWSACVGAMRANAIRVAVPSPLVGYMDAVETLRTLEKQRLGTEATLEPGAGQLEWLWPFLEAVERKRRGGLGGASGVAERAASDAEGSGSESEEEEESGEAGSASEASGAGSGSEGGSEEEEDEEMLFWWGSRAEPRSVSSRIFAPRDGTAVFPLVSLMNHACQHNAQVNLHLSV